MFRRRFALLVATTVATAAVGLVACKEDTQEKGASTSPPPSPSPVITPPALVEGSALRGTISSPGQADLFTFAITSAGERVELDLDAEALVKTASFDGSKIDGRLTVYGPDGSLQRIVNDGTTVASPQSMRDPFLEFAAPLQGTYTVSVDDAHGNGAAIGYDYKLRASHPTVAPLDTGDTCATAVLLTNLDLSYSSFVPAAASNSLGTTYLPCINGTAPGPDINYKAFLTSGQKIQIVRTGRRTDGSIWDGALYLFSSCGGGTPDAVSCAIGGDGSDEADGVVFTPVVTGTYFIMVDSIAPAPGANLPFQLDVRTFPAGE